MNVPDLLQRANAEFGQVCDCMEVIDESKDLVKEEDGVYIFQDGARFKLTTQEERVS